MKKISVVVPSYNSFLTIGRTIDALLKETPDLLEEIIVVDSSDDQKTPELLLAYKSEKFNLIRLSKRTIPALGRNIGAEKARAKVLAFIDSDAYPDEHWLRNISLAYENGCRVGGGPILLPDFQKRSMIAAAQYFLQFNEFMDVGQKRIKDFVPSCNLFCEKELFQSVGGFPDIRASEDVLFGLKVRQKAKLYFVPEIKVYHFFRKDLGSYLKNQELLGRYIIIYRRQHFNRWIYKGWVPVILLPAFLGIKFLGIILRVLKSGRPGLFFLFLVSLPLFLLGLYFWGWGFLNGSISKGLD